MVNIITNAKDALVLNNIVEKYIFINAYIKNNSVLIEIKDNAKGIDNKIIDKIFEPYFTTKHKDQGTGLGLYMTHQLLISMAGTIEAKNTRYTHKETEFTGTSFTIKLPIKPFEK